MKKQWKQCFAIFTVIIMAMNLVSTGLVRGENQTLSPAAVENKGPEESNTKSDVSQNSSDQKAALPENVSDNEKAGNAHVNLDHMEAMQETEYLKLFINRSSTEIAVLDKRSGQVWYSNPPDLAQDTQTAPYTKGRLSSQIYLVYLTPSGQTKEYDSFNDSVKKQQFEIGKQGDSIFVTYHFGSNEKGLDYLPEKISKKRLEELLLNRLEDQDEKDEIISRYKYFEKEGIYERREIPKSALKRVVDIFEKAGYTYEDLEADHKENGVTSTGETGNAKFTVQLQYALDKDNLLVTVDTKNIEESKPFKIHSIGLMNNFGAAGKNDNGYIFIPDGSGALIYLNNGKTLSQPVTLPVYGEDNSLYAEEKISMNESSRMPVFGLMKNNSSFFAIIEEGEALAKISADVSGRLHGYNVVGSQFTILPKDTLKLNNREFSVKTPQKMYQGNVKIRYAFLNGNHANYSGMAAYYREYLVNRYGLKKINKQDDIPFYLELIGLVNKPQSLFGIPYETPLLLTDIKQAGDIVNLMEAKQVENIHLKYTGWCNGGVRHTLPSSMKMDRALGTKGEWEAFNDRLKSSGGKLYPNVSLLRVYKNSKDFNPSKDASQFLSRKVAKVFQFSRARYTKRLGRFSHYIVSPNALENIVGDFLQSYKQYDTGGVSLDDIGVEVNSDFNQKQPVDRQKAVEMIDKQMQRIYNNVPDAMLNGGNVYLLPYARHLLNIPHQSNQYQIEDGSVPFYQMVLHGYVEYAGKAFNLADDQNLRMNILRSIETGANVYYSWIGSEPSPLKDTIYDDIYANYYKNWVSEAAQAYQEVNVVLKQVNGQCIISHTKLAEGVYKTTYENGKSVIVNYSNEDVTVEGETIAAEQYKIKE